MMAEDFPAGSMPVDRFGGVVTDPTEVPGKLRQAVQRNAIPMAAMTGVDLAATALAPETMGLSLILPAVAAGMTNIATGRLLPEKYGGEPGRSKKSLFAWGAVPSLLGGAAARGLEHYAIKKGGTAAYEGMLGSLRSGPSEAAQGERAAGALGRPLEPMAPLTGEAQTDASFNLRDAILNPILRMRRKLGEPIGAAYDALKGNADPAPIEDLATSVEEIRSGARSPITARANGLLNDAKRLSNRLKPATEAAPSPEGVDVPIPETPKKPPSLDEVRDLRQRVNAALRTAKGGDYYALSLLEHRLDETLLPFLGDTIGRDRALYAGFIRRYPYAKLNALRQMGTTGQIGPWLFKMEPALSKEIIDAAEPAERDVMGEAFKDYLVSGVNPHAPVGEQMGQIRKAVQPYIQNGTAQRLLGAGAETELRDVLYSPLNRKALADMMDRPDQRAAFQQAWTDAIKKGGAARLRAAQKGFRAMIGSLDPAEQRQLMAMVQKPGVSLPVVPSTAGAIETGLKTPGTGATMMQYGQRRLAFGGTQAAGRVLLGNPMGAVYGASVAMAFGAMAAGQAGMRAFLENGGAGLMARVYASPGGRAYAQNLFKALVDIGSRGVQGGTYRPQEEFPVGTE